MVNMSLNLVPYGSDSDSDDENDQSPSETNVHAYVDPLPGSSKSIPDKYSKFDINQDKSNGDEDLSTNDSTIFKKLPCSSGTSKNLNLKLTSLGVSVDKESKKIKISIPSLEDLDCDSDDDDEIKDSKLKKITPAGYSSLLSYLPKPRNQPISFSSSSVTKMIPYSLSRAKSDNSNNLRATSAIKAEDSVTFSKPIVNILGPDLIPPTVSENHISASFKRPADTTEDLKEPQPKKSTPVIDINDPTYKKYISHQFGEDIPDQAQVIDVNVSQYLKSDTEHLKSISMERPSQDAGPAPNSLARRKHQITYLAYQAKQRELDLKNQAAANKLTKAQTRAKYGF